MSTNDILANRHAQLQDAFEKMFMDTVAPEDAAMFENAPSPDEHCFYFSPGAVTIFGPILKSYGATECEAPPRGGTSLLVGHAGAWDMLP